MTQIDYLIINDMTKLGSLVVGKKNQITIMGILNISPESFYKKSIKSTKSEISKYLCDMEENGANIIDIGGMSTAPYLKTIVSEKIESERITKTIKIIQNLSNIPISVDTCRASVAKDALELGIDVINDISGLKYDKNMPKIVEKYNPSLILCSYSKKLVKGNSISVTKQLLNQSIKIAKNAQISKDKIVVDPAIGFFRRSSDVKNNLPYTKITSDWAQRDIEIIKKLKTHVFELGLVPIIPLSGIDSGIFDNAKEIGLEKHIPKIEKFLRTKIQTISDARILDKDLRKLMRDRKIVSVNHGPNMIHDILDSLELKH